MVKQLNISLASELRRGGRSLRVMDLAQSEENKMKENHGHFVKCALDI